MRLFVLHLICAYNEKRRACWHALLSSLYTYFTITFFVTLPIFTMFTPLCRRSVRRPWMS
jgi:hypothetical protein